MKAISILVHSIRLLFNNLDAALRISIVPYVILTVVNTYFQIQIAPYQDPSNMPATIPGGGFWFMMFLAIIAMIVIGLWIAVAWHRYILLEEISGGLIPQFHGNLVLSYFGRGLLIGILCAIAAFFAGMVIGFIAGVLMGPIAGGVVGGTAGAIVGLILFYRMCPILPAAAVGRNLSVRDAMAATTGQGGTIISLAVIGGLVIIILQLPSLIGGDPLSPISLVYSAVIGWFTTLIGVSVLTTFYGHFVEGREID